MARAQVFRGSRVHLGRWADRRHSPIHRRLERSML